MNKKLIRLTEQDLHRIVKESVEKIIRENAYGTQEKEFDKSYSEHWPEFNGEDDPTDDFYYFDNDGSTDKMLTPSTLRDDLSNDFRYRYVHRSLPKEIEKDVNDYLNRNKVRKPKGREKAEIQKYGTSRYNTQPLHRKGSLNRAFDD